MSRPIRIGILDSGVNAAHPHVGGLAGGVGITPQGPVSDYVDRLGHGTAVAALIHHLNPAAELMAVKVFEGKLATTLPIILRAIDWCLEQRVDVINLSLGTVNPAHRAAFAGAVEKSCRAGAVIVSALEMDGVPALPGALDGVIGVLPAEPGDAGYQCCARYQKVAYTAPPYPRDISGVPRERNLRGVSFAVARISALVARARARHHDGYSWHDQMNRLIDQELPSGCVAAT